MSITIKRKRGRPRLDEPREIKVFDNNLIQEFKKFPVFYDRQHPEHRNRDYTDRIWQRIAQNLNVSVNIVKTRMLQLRNRFNLEKRRVEAMKNQQPHSCATSQWCLYESLSFLSDYVKTRRPYSLPVVTYNTKVDSTASSSDADEDEDDEGTKTHDNILNSNHVLLNGGLLSDNTQNEDILSPNQNHSIAESANIQQAQQNMQKPLEVNRDSGNNKYKAFGQFLTTSLIEMNEIQALNLVEKFTTKLVKYLKTEERKKCLVNAPQRSNTGDEENSLSVY